MTMTRATIAGGVFILALVVLAAALGYRALDRSFDRGDEPLLAPASETQPAAQSSRGFLYGRVRTVDGAGYEGRLRWGRDQEAFWGDLFNGAKRDNPWLAQVPAELRPRERSAVAFLGIELARRDRPIPVERPFVARCGDIARIEASGREVRVTLKSGSVFDLDRLDASDFDDGLRVWNAAGGAAPVDLDSLRIRSIEFLAAPAPGPAPYRLHGTVRTRQGEFTGFVAWDREEGVGTDALDGRGEGGEVSVRYDTIRSIARRPGGGSLVTLVDGREIGLAESGEAGEGNRGIYVDDRRYGRVLVSRDAFERAEFGPGPGPGSGSGPGYDDFPPGIPLRGSVTRRAGRPGGRLAGRLVYDLDESETTDTLDAPSKGVDYTLPFGLVASIVPLDGGARVTLHDGEVLELERAGDVGDGNAGLLIFADGVERPEYVAWSDVERLDFDRPPALDAPAGGR